jgi:hypothetical protein
MIGRVQVGDDGELVGVEERDGIVRVPEHVIYRAFQSETVLLNLKTGQYHGLNATGGRMLELLRETGSTEATAERIADEYGVPLAEVRTDLSAFCSDLAARGLIEMDEPSGG